jgi:hypothetical protein
MPNLLRWRQIAEAADPQKISDLVAATGVFSAEEARVAGQLAATTLDGTETYRFLFVEEPGGSASPATTAFRSPMSASICTGSRWRPRNGAAAWRRS